MILSFTLFFFSYIEIMWYPKTVNQGLIRSQGLVKMLPPPSHKVQSTISNAGRGLPHLDALANSNTTLWLYFHSL